MDPAENFKIKIGQDNYEIKRTGEGEKSEDCRSKDSWNSLVETKSRA